MLEEHFSDSLAILVSMIPQLMIRWYVFESVGTLADVVGSRLT